MTLECRKEWFKLYHVRELHLKQTLADSSVETFGLEMIAILVHSAGERFTCLTPFEENLHST
jgi:hypothetical protein